MKRINDIDGMLEELCSEMVGVNTEGKQTRANPIMIPCTSHSRIRAIVPKYVEDESECQTVNEIVTSYLKEIGADGLCDTSCDCSCDCSCELDDLMRCQMIFDCQPAYRHADGTLRPEKPEEVTQ